MKNNSLTLVMLLSALSILVSVHSLNSIYSQENSTEHVPKFFAIQHAQSGSISEINETAYSLELNEVSDKTILFSDRPDRIVMSESTSDFIGNWSIGTNSYAVDSPNAVLVVDEIERQDDVIIELFNPVYDVNKNALKYDVTQDNSTLIDMYVEFGKNMIVIDPGGPWDPSQ